MPGPKSFLREYFEILWDRWWLVVVTIAGGVLWAIDFALHFWGYTLDLPRWTPPVVFLVGLIAAQFLAVAEMRRQRNEALEKIAQRSRTDELMNQLGVFIAEGSELQRQCGKENEPPPQQAADVWGDRVVAFLQANLGDGYVARLSSHAGLPVPITSIFSDSHRQLWSALGVYLARLNEFSREVAARL